MPLRKRNKFGNPVKQQAVNKLQAALSDLRYSLAYGQRGFSNLTELLDSFPPGKRAEVERLWAAMDKAGGELVEALKENIDGN